MRYAALALMVFVAACSSNDRVDSATGRDSTTISQSGTKAPKACVATALNIERRVALVPASYGGSVEIAAHGASHDGFVGITARDRDGQFSTGIFDPNQVRQWLEGPTRGIPIDSFTTNLPATKPGDKQSEMSAILGEPGKSSALFSRTIEGTAVSYTLISASAVGTGLFTFMTPSAVAKLRAALRRGLAAADSLCQHG